MPSSVPSSGPLSLKDLHDDFRRYPETNPTNISLGSLIDDFLCENPTNQLISSFHGATYLKPFIISTLARFNVADSCEVPRPNFGGKGATVVYHNGTTTNPAVGDTIYTSYKGFNGSSCSNTTFSSVGKQIFFRMDNGKVAEVRNTGVVLSVNNC